MWDQLFKRLPNRPSHEEGAGDLAMKLKVLVACEESGTVREAFAKLGHDVWSCDILPSRIPGQHIQGDAIEAAYGGQWDLMIAHPPCTYLTVTGNRWFKPEYAARYPDRANQREAATEFFMKLAYAPVPRIAIENPICIMSTRWRKPDQIIQPWMFGDPDLKKTALWLINLPPLMHSMETDLLFEKTHVAPRYKEFNSSSNPSGKSKYPLLWAGKRDASARSKTFQGVANAFASQWGNLP